MNILYGTVIATFLGTVWIRLICLFARERTNIQCNKRNGSKNTRLVSGLCVWVHADKMLYLGGFWLPVVSLLRCNVASSALSR